MSRSSAVPPPVTAVMDAASGWLPARLARVEERLHELTRSHGALLAGDAETTLAAGGKRLRPLLVLLCAGSEQTATRPGEGAIRAATAIELVHMATLVHDDVLDRAPLRRGQPTVAARSGPAQAMAVGDLLFSRAFAELTEPGDEHRVQLLSSSSVALAMGELAQRRDAFDTSISAERYLERCRLKTARLFECACLLGRPASSDGETELARFGDRIGLAFQLLDDVLDVKGPPERTGKARGTDLIDGTVTLPLILARQADPELAKAQLRDLDGAGAEELCKRIAATAALEEVTSMALHQVAEAKELLETPAFPEEERRLLGLVADGVVERYS
jgi:geranylgeranyl pyrophosphate synthase